MRWLALFIFCCTTGVHAGRSCEPYTPTPEIVARAAAMGVRVADRVQFLSPGHAALIARVGTDLSRYDLKYSHIAVISRQSEDSKLRITHLLNHCESSESAIYEEGLAQFFLDAPILFDALILQLDDQTAEQLGHAIETGAALRVHDERYNVLAHHGSTRSQNSSQWVLETLALATTQPGVDIWDRGNAQRMLEGQSYQPDVIRLKFGQRLFGNLADNVNLFHQPRRNRLRNRFEIMSVRSVSRFLENSGRLIQADEIIPPCNVVAKACDPANF